MAELINLARSYYAWRKKLPIKGTKQFYRSDLFSLQEDSRRVLRKFKATQYGERAGYWQKMFENYRLDENAMRAVLDTLNRVFSQTPPPPVIPDNILFQKVREIARFINKHLNAIEDRRRQTTLYHFLRNVQREDERIMISKKLNLDYYETEPDDYAKPKGVIALRVIALNWFGFLKGTIYGAASGLEHLYAGTLYAADIALHQLWNVLRFLARSVWGERKEQELTDEATAGVTPEATDAQDAGSGTR